MTSLTDVLCVSATAGMICLLELMIRSDMLVICILSYMWLIWRLVYSSGLVLDGIFTSEDVFGASSMIAKSVASVVVHWLLHVLLLLCV